MKFEESKSGVERRRSRRDLCGGVVTFGMSVLTFFLCFLIPVDAADKNRPAIKNAQNQSIKIVKVSRKYVDNGSQVDVSYPRFVGSAVALTKQLNDKVKAVLDTNLIYDMEGGSKHFKRPGSTFSGSYEAHLVTPHVVSVLMNFYHYYAGTPHGESHYVYFNYELTPQLKPLKLSDIIGKGADYKALSELLFNKLFKDGRDKIDLTDSEQIEFTFDKHGINWDFGNYSVGSYADGCPKATVSYPELDRVVAPTFRADFKKWQSDHF
jgi:hypothetical protein